ncbi:MAG: hypothetical protein K2M06_07010 [Muribaculaceae bacterium]|nr:hypothetical protein [Muribaculaceae bacterium]
MKKFVISLALTAGAVFSVMAYTAGAGSYLTTFPGTDAAGRNSYPQGPPALSGAAAELPAPTNDWWSNELINPHGAGIFNYPMGLKPVDEGLVLVRPFEQQAITAENPLLVGIEGISATQTTVCNHSDWTVTLSWRSGSAAMEATIGQGMPLVYFTRTAGAGPVRVSFTGGVAKSVAPNVVVITGCYNNAKYVLYSPSGSTWSVNGNIISSDLNGKNYWSVGMLPDDKNPEQTAKSWEASAFAFPAETRAEWSYTPSDGRVVSRYIVNTDVKEGPADSAPIVGLLPHHWANLAEGENVEAGSEGSFSTVRGSLKLAKAKSFATDLTFSGILGVLPSTQQAATGYDLEALKKLVDQICNDNGLSDWTDSYNDGQLLNRLSQTALVAREAGYEAGAKKAIDIVKRHLEKWFTAKPGDVAFVFYYHEPWKSLLAYPAGHGQDSNLNDHNFHYGYFIEAAATVATFYPEWVEEWGPMVDLLVRDVASVSRDDKMFPYMRSFSPYSGHCWANGFATLGAGADQESSSEAMAAHSAIMKWAEVRGDNQLRDAAVWMYATELSAIQEYWFDTQSRNRPSGYRAALASRIFANGYDDQNFWGGGIAGSYGIQVYPVQPSSAYLVQDSAYAEKLWKAMCSETRILAGEDNPNIWYDAWTQYVSLLNPAEALSFYESNRARMGKKFGATEALTYYWIHSLAVAGTPDFTLTADSPMAQAYRNGRAVTYAASNYTSEPKTVKFSNGQTLSVKPYSNAFFTDGDVEPIVPPVKPEPTEPDPENPDDPTPGTPTGECLTTSTASTEGSFKAPYVVGFKTLEDKTSVRVSASFEMENEYVGFAGPWLFNETNGFAEVPMTKDYEGGYSAVLTGLTAGQQVKVRVKIAFAGGMALTDYCTYEVGKNCGTTGGMSPELPGLEVSTVLRDGVLVVTSGCEAYATLFAADGRLAGAVAVEADFAARMNVSGLVPGVFILRVEPVDESVAPYVARFVIK